MKEYSIEKLNTILRGIQTVLDDNKEEIFKGEKYVGFKYKDLPIVKAKLAQRKKILRKIRKAKKA